MYTIIKILKNEQKRRKINLLERYEIKNRCLHVPECTCVIISQQMDNCFSQVGILSLVFESRSSVYKNGLEGRNEIWF